MLRCGVIEYNGELCGCPFCGQEPVVVKDIRYPRPDCNPQESYEVVCKTLGCPIYKADNTYFSTLEMAVKRWNQRYHNIFINHNIVDDDLDGI